MAAAADRRARSLEIRRTYKADPARVFAAWTQPEQLRRWWGVAEGYTTPVAEVDLRVGGRYRLGMLSPDEDDLKILSGEYLEIEPPEKLVFTWGIEVGGVVANPSTITLRFSPQGSGTELVLLHEYVGPPEMAENFRTGWSGMFARLEKTLAPGENG